MAAIPKNKLSGFWPKSTWKNVSTEELKPLRELYRRARFLDVYELSQKIAPLQAWTGGDARNFAADLAGHLAGYRLSDWLDVTSYRDQPDSEEAQIGYAALLRARKGYLESWWFLDRHPLQPGHSAKYKFEWLTERAAIARHFRDFESARKYLEEAKPFCERPEFLHISHCFLLRAEDRREEALEEALKAESIRSTHISAIRQIAEILLEQNKDAECLSFLDRSLEKVQDSYLLSLRIRLKMETEQFSEVLSDLDLYEKWAPLMEIPIQRWLNSRRADVCYQLNRFDEAIDWARKLQDEDFYGPFADRLEQERKRQRVRLGVGFIRQDHNTCAPATLTALARFWGLSTEHGEVVESICYDGTYDFQERKWVEENGFYAREFKVNWETSVQLIDRGIPFALVTSWPGSAHLQAVIGYDLIWKSLLIRDPGERDLSEFNWEKTKKDYQAVGPRGMALVPIEKRNLLEGLELPESELFDANYLISRALDRHQRDEALTFLQKMEKQFPGERMTIVGRRLIAGYDNNVPEQMACVQKLLELFPKDERHGLSLLSCLRDMGSREDRLKLLREITAKQDCYPLFWKELATEIMEDSRAQKEGLYFLKKAHRLMPSNTHTVSKIAGLFWDRGETATAAVLYRFVACADDKNEGASKSYFIATRQTKQINEAIDFLKRRLKEYGSRSSQPVRTLFYALEQLHRLPEAFAAMEEAVAMRPKDGELLCYLADLRRRYGGKDEARRLLKEAEKECPRARWLRTSAGLAETDGELSQALQFWKEAAHLEPLAEDAHRQVADLLSKTEGRKEALAYLRAVHDRFPHNLDLSRLLLSWLKNENGEEAIDLCRSMVANHPTDAWALRELATQLSNLPTRLDEALTQAKLARDLEPRSSYGYGTLGHVYRKLGRLEEAKDCLRQSIRLQIDNSYSIETLIELDTSLQDKRRDLLFIREELVRQVVFGDGLQEFHQQAKRALPEEDVLLYLTEARDARPDLWQAWSSLTYQLSHMGLKEEALAMAKQTAAKFPMTTGSWRNLGDMYCQQDNWAKAAESMEKAVALASDWVAAITELSEIYERQKLPEKARSLLETSIRNNPSSPVLRGFLADNLFHQGKKAEALEEIRLLVQISPNYNWGLEKLREWGTREECLEICRNLTQKRPGEASSWRILADNLDSSKDLEEILEALDKAIALDPGDIDVYDSKALVLAENKRFEEALAVCHSMASGDFMPVTLRGREAWIENERGNRKKAIALIQAVVTDDSGYFWGWSRLSDWLLEENKVPEAVRASDQMVRLKPSIASPLGYRADARLKQGNRYGAIQDLRRAHILDPDYGFATWTLFDLILDDDEHEEARILLEDAKRYSKPGKISVAEIKLELSNGQLSEAIAKLKLFGADDEAVLGDLESVQKEFGKREVLEEFDRVVDEMVTSKTASGPLLSIWVSRQTSRKQWNLRSTINQYLREDKTRARFAVESYLRACGDADCFESYGIELYQHHGDWIDEDSYTWGLMVFALYHSKQYRWCAKWAEQWKTRNGVQKWMFVNLARCFQNLEKSSDCGEINRRILELEPSHSFANLYLAFSLALEEDHQAAEKFLLGVDETTIASNAKMYLAATRAIIAFLKSSDRQRPSFQTAKKDLQTQFAALSVPHWEFVRAYYIALAKLAELHGNPSAFYYKLKGGEIARVIFLAPVSLPFLLKRIKTFFILLMDPPPKE